MSQLTYNEIVCDLEGYKDALLSMCPKLSILDGQRIKAAGDQFYRLSEKLEKEQESKSSTKQLEKLLETVPGESRTDDKVEMDESFLDAMDNKWQGKSSFATDEENIR